MLKSVIYVSKSTKPVSKDVLKSILESSRKNNTKLNVTGLLLYFDSTFIQALEGPAESIDIIFSNIKEDKRHQDVTVIHEEPITMRDFSNWSMGFKSLDKEDEHLGFASLEEIESILKRGDGLRTKAILSTFYHTNVASSRFVETS